MHGVRYAFGVPGGGSSLDMIEAFSRHGIAFQLCRTETGAALMAAADAEIRNGFGVVITTQGPGTASAMNGLAHSALDRAPILLISDGWTPARAAYDTHQVFDQRLMSSAVVKGSTRLDGPEPGAEMDALIRLMLSAPWGPVHLELTSETARRAAAIPAQQHNPDLDGHGEGADSTDYHGRPLDLLKQARKPVLVVGLEARERGVSGQILALAESLQCPVLTTYKAKGVVSDECEWLVGHFTGGAAERECVDAADLIVLCGLDPVELIGRPWPYRAAVIDVALVRHPVHYMAPQAGLYGSLRLSLETLKQGAAGSSWKRAEIDALRSGMHVRLAYAGSEGGLSPQAVVETAMRLAGAARPAITVDAGAHMFSAMAFWRACAPGRALISNGLATMGYALPAGIARSLNHPDEQVIVFTGDGGLMMCAGELATAAQAGNKLCVVVFNDAALSLIALKQRDRGMPDTGVSWPQADFAAVARGFGMQAYRASTEAEYEQALRQAFQSGVPCLIDVHVDPSGYGAQARSLRG
ncbi:thiamine pyrophosphate-binding protein [Bordetella petrii]|nr:thiamine pyrophosphate-binding protein [Bordetella petrii]